MDCTDNTFSFSGRSPEPSGRKTLSDPMSHVSGTLWREYGSKAYYDANGDLMRQIKNFLDGTAVVFDGSGRVAAVKEPDGHTREFEYGEDGELTKIRGHLGTWKRTTDENGNTVWANQDTGQTWKGDFRVDPAGRLHFDPQNMTGLRIQSRRPAM